ncbi:hypothetical protein BHUM_00760c [Candidatus Burkholderia humilis]|nr:hypothetical protein BHUM_00760c [Candidatus Burkholderia humilis]
MNNRFLLLALPLALLSGCTSYYVNVDACKNRMRADYPGAASAPLKITGSGAAYQGSRVIVRGTMETDPVPPATKKLQAPVAAECTFNEKTLTGFQWLSPAVFAKKTAPADE